MSALEDLLRITRTLEFEEHGRMRLAAGFWERERPRLQFEVDDGRDQLSRWSDPDRVLGQLWAAHHDLAGDWIPFDRYLNGAVPLPGLLRTSSAFSPPARPS